MSYAILANCRIHSMRVLYRGLLEFRLKSGSIPSFFLGFCEAMYSGFRYRLLVLPDYIFASEIERYLFRKMRSLMEYNNTTINMCD